MIGRWVLVAWIGFLGACSSVTHSTDRSPAAFESLGDSEVPANTVYSTGSLEPSRSEVAASVSIEDVPFSAFKNGLSLDQIQLVTGIQAVRARAVRISDTILRDLLNRKPGREYSIRVELFEGEFALLHLQVKSDFEVNKGLHSGVVDGPARSNVQLSIELTKKFVLVSAFIDWGSSQYRIVSDPLRNCYYVIQTR